VHSRRNIGINVVDLFKLEPHSGHGHGLTDRDFDSLFTLDKPVLFNFHGYPWLIHRLAYRRTNHPNFHVRGYKQVGAIDTPLNLAIRNQIDRFNPVIDVIARVPSRQVAGAHVKEQMKNQVIDNTNYAWEEGIDKPEISDWQGSLCCKGLLLIAERCCELAEHAGDDHYP